MLESAEISPKWAWEPYIPSASMPWNLQRAGHLFRRAGFGASRAELDRAVKDGPEQTIAMLFRGGPGQEMFQASLQDMADSMSRVNNGQQLAPWWLFRMLATSFPLQEKMTLFWHNHFATSNGKVQNVAFMLRQYELLRKHCLGNFESLLKQMSTDPAMLIWLDGRGSKKGNPNENYARELMELFSLGIGNYTETDIRQAARAFTGWEIRGNEVRFRPDQFDDGKKTVFNRVGDFHPDDIVKLCLEKKSAPDWICHKLFRFLVSETMIPDSALLQPLSNQFRQREFDIGSLVETILRSNLFFSQQSYRTRIKSPVEFAIGIIHGLEGRVGTTALAVTLQEMGQNLFYPPSVKGWDGGPAWLNGQTLLYRQNLALALTSTGDIRFGGQIDPVSLVNKVGCKKPADILDLFLTIFLDNNLPAASRERLLKYQLEPASKNRPVYWSEEDAENQKIRSLCHLVFMQPEFQLA